MLDDIADRDIILSTNKLRDFIARDNASLTIIIYYKNYHALSLKTRKSPQKIQGEMSFQAHFVPERR